MPVCQVLLLVCAVFGHFLVFKKEAPAGTKKRGVGFLGEEDLIMVDSPLPTALHHKHNHTYTQSKSQKMTSLFSLSHCLPVDSKFNSLTAKGSHCHTLSAVAMWYHSSSANFYPFTEFDSMLNMQRPLLLCSIFLFLQSSSLQWPERRLLWHPFCAECVMCCMVDLGATISM